MIMHNYLIDTDNKKNEVLSLKFWKNQFEVEIFIFFFYFLSFGSSFSPI